MQSHSKPSFTKRILFLINPSAGGGAGRHTARRIESLLRDKFQISRSLFDIELTDPHDLQDQTVQACHHYTSIIAVGGDGTASWILQGIFKQGGSTQFGLIPLGTGNDLARSLGIYDPRITRSDRSLQRALNIVLTGQPRLLDLFEIQGAGLFCNYAGVGLDARVLSDYEAFKRTALFGLIRRSRALKFLLYGFLLIKHLGYRLPPGILFSVHDGNSSTHPASQQTLRAIIISNTRTYAGGFMLTPGSKTDDRLFEITWIRGIPDLLRVLFARFTPFQFLTRGLLRTKTDTMEWTAPPNLPFEWDGELSAAPFPTTGSVRCAGQVQVLLPTASKVG
jgi:diacylglycerol kinase family enzyme